VVPSNVLIPDARSTRRRNLLPEVQALRAIAVLLVVVYHLWPGRLTGGFIGVDVFFVISGFLITGHLLRELDLSGRIKILEFWARRIRRLLPASLLVLALTAVGVLVLVPYNQWQSFLKSVLGSALYVENWVLASDSVNYWAQGQASPPTQHYWSLSVEEQFYFVWPLLITAAALLVGLARRRWAIGALLAIVFCASLAYSIYDTHASQQSAYFVTPTRGWEFAAGGLLSLVAWKPRQDWLRSAFGWVGLALIASAALRFTGSSPFPGWIALVPVVGTALVIWSGAPESAWSFTPIAKVPHVQFLGDISYSVYLWHWPMIVLIPWAVGHPLGILWKSAIVVGTILLAWATKVLVEDPLRSAPALRARRSIPTFAFAAATMAAVTAIAGVSMSYEQNWETARLAAAHRTADSTPSCFGAPAGPTGAGCATDATAGSIVPNPIVAPNDDDPQIEACISQEQDPSVIGCHFGNAATATIKIALVGDSHAGALAPAFKRLAQTQHWYVTTYLKSGCPWSDIDRVQTDGYTPAIKYCRDWEHQVSQRLATAHLDAVVTTGYRVVNNLVQPTDGQDVYDTSVRQLTKTWSAYTQRSGTPVLAVADGPNWPGQSPVDCLILNKRSPASCAVSKQDAFAIGDPQADAVKQTLDARLLDLSDVYCGDTSCPAVIGGAAVYRDQNHFTRTFAVSLAPIIGDRVKAAIGARPATGD